MFFCFFFFKWHHFISTNTLIPFLFVLLWSSSLTITTHRLLFRWIKVTNTCRGRWSQGLRLSFCHFYSPKKKKTNFNLTSLPARCSHLTLITDSLPRTRSWWSCRTAWRWSNPTWGGKRRPWPRRHRPQPGPSCPRGPSLPPPRQAPARGGAAAAPPRQHQTQKTGRRPNDSSSSLCSRRASTTRVAFRKSTWRRTLASCVLASILLPPAPSSPPVDSGGSTDLCGFYYYCYYYSKYYAHSWLLLERVSGVELCQIWTNF